MKIKDAAKYCGLTEKAIRLYESKGLISPPTEDKNGRSFREYDDDTLRDLMSISVLRRASFSIEQIGTMQSHPEMIPEILDTYREELRSNAHRLTLLCEIMDNINVDEHFGIDSIAKYISNSALSGNNCISSDTSEEEPLPAPVPKEFRWTVWDEDISEESKAKALELFWQQFEKRERRKDIALAIPRAISKIWKAIPRAIRITVLSCIAAICIVALILYNAKNVIPYTLTVDGIEYFMEDYDPDVGGTVGEKVTITFDGEIHNYLFKEDYFTGKMTVEGYELYQRFFPPHTHGNPEPIWIPATEVTVDNFFSNSHFYYNRFYTYYPELYSGTDYFKNSYKLERYNIHVIDFDDPKNAIIMIPFSEMLPAVGLTQQQKRVGYIIAPAESESDAEYLYRRIMEEHKKFF
ncbi:MAG: MerR family transcriptional regulator [Ruminococcaceae bacterium]|nr:MerR family transcriptional regulator [Oscillospiraceae bacterium]